MDKMSMNVRVRLSAMMFLQFMMFAVWWVPLATYLGKDGLNAGTKLTALILSTMALGCLTSPIVGMIADRHFASQKVLAVLNLLCTVLVFIAAKQTESVAFFVLLLIAMLCYMPTWGLTSAIALAHSPTDKFPQIRVFGSIGWVASGICSLVALKLFKTTIDGTEIPMLCGAGIGIVAVIVNLTLPNTPPPAKGQKASVVDALGFRAVSLMKDANFAVFIAISTLVMIPFTIYFSYCSRFLKDQGFDLITVTMNWGQFGEIFFMLLIPLALAKIGVRWAMFVGLATLAIRYVAFLFGGMFDQTWLYFVGVLVHGIIFGFFFVGGQIYVDKKAPKEIRAQAQGFMFLITFGIGMFIGNFFNGELIARYTTQQIINGVETDLRNWTPIWAITTIISVVLLGVYLVFFRDKLESSEEAQLPIANAAEENA